MERPPWLRACIEAGRRLHFRHEVPWRHNLRNLGWLGLMLGLGATLVGLGRLLPLPVYLLLAGPGMGLLFFATFILVVHEASHGMFLLHRDTGRRLLLNRLFGTVFALPFGVHYKSHWEEGHIVHHRHPIEAHDPQRFNRDTGPAFVRTALLYLLVPGWAVVHRFLSRGSRQRRHTSQSVLMGALAFWLGAGCLGALIGGAGVPLSFFIGVQVLFGLNQLKGALEHGGELAFDPDPLLRSRSTLFPLRQLLMPFHISLHWEHHLQMGVPWYRLPQLHRTVLPLVPVELHPYLFNRRPGRQLLGRLGPVPRSCPEQALAG